MVGSKRIEAKESDHVKVEELMLENCSQVWDTSPQDGRRGLQIGLGNGDRLWI
jgi:hypothetical protein